ncbi:MAG TPA: hypothetical protein PK604_04625 [Acetivibrio clariflavus]|nr:hypothetical protein [Acetivibrio clariflavus]HPU41869.1 hypothetical protein [Acetivibrio clariflavus]
MQLEGFLLLLTMIIIIPIIYIASDDTVFFIIFSMIIAFSSIKNILGPFLPNFIEDDEETEDLIEELKDSISLDFNKIKLGIETVKAMIFILYFIYSCFFIGKFIFKIATVFIIVYWIRYVLENIKKNTENSTNSENQTSFLNTTIKTLVNVMSLIVILTTNYNRFLK